MRTLKSGHEFGVLGQWDQLVSIEGWKLQDVVARLRGKDGTQVSLFVVRSGVGTIVTLIRRKLPELESGREHPKAELATAYSQFDQTPHQGWRALAEQKRFGEAAELISAYLDAHPELRADERINLHFHAAQCLALAGGAKSVQDALEHLGHARYASEPPNTPIRWNDYVSATEAFLRERSSAGIGERAHRPGPKLNGEQANLDVVDRLIANFRQVICRSLRRLLSPAQPRHRSIRTATWPGRRCLQRRAAARHQIRRALQQHRPPGSSAASSVDARKGKEPMTAPALWVPSEATNDCHIAGSEADGFCGWQGRR